MGTAGLKIPRKYFHTAETDAVIADAYRRFRDFASRKAIAGAAVKLGWPRTQVNKRAKQLCLARTKERPWSDAEEQVLEQYSGLSVAVIARKLRAAGYQRSDTAIHLKMKRLKIRATPNYYTKCQLAKAFGIDDHKVSVWINAGFLKAGWKGTQRSGAQGNDTFAIHRDDVRRFILHHPEEVELARIGETGKYWLFDLLSGGKICEEFRKEAA